jgi:hypothetical protein
MKFRKRMKPILEEFQGLIYEAVDWYHSYKHAYRKADQYRNQGFNTLVLQKKDWNGWFVYINS